MNRIAFIIWLSFVLSTIFMMSCQNADMLQQEAPIQGVENEEREQELVNSLKFKSPSKEDATLRSGRHETSLVVVRVTWGRRSRDCRGFGICEAQWFPGWSDWFDDVFSRSESIPDGAEGVVFYDNDGNRYLRLELAEEVRGFTHDELIMIVEERVEMPNSGVQAHLEGYVIDAGRYEFSATIGEHGGYIIPVKEL